MGEPGAADEPKARVREWGMGDRGDNVPDGLSAVPAPGLRPGRGLEGSIEERRYEGDSARGTIRGGEREDPKAWAGAVSV